MRKQYNSTLQQDSDLAALVIFAEDMDYEIEHSPFETGAHSLSNRKIRVGLACYTTDKNRTLAMFAHEIGHAISMNRRRVEEALHLASKYSFLFPVIDESVVEEERTAWRLGARVLRTLGIKYNRREYGVYASKCLQTYIDSGRQLGFLK